MWFLEKIVYWLGDARDWFLDASYDVVGWPWPFWRLYQPLYYIYVAFHYLTWYFDQFNIWLEWAANRINAILGIWDIWSYFKEWFEAGWNAWVWVFNAAYNIWTEAARWWSSVWANIVEWLNGWFAWLTGQIDSLKDAIDVLAAKIVAGVDLEAWLKSILADIDKLINDTIKEWFPFYDSLAQLWDSIAEFFADPLDWLYKKLDDFFERYW